MRIRFFFPLMLWQALCWISPVKATDISLGYGYSYGEARFGLPMSSEFKTQSLNLSLQWENGIWGQDTYIDIEIPHLEMTGPAALLSIIPLRDFVRLDRDRRIRYLQLLDIYSPQDIQNFKVSGTSDVTLASGVYLTEPWLDDYSLSLSFKVKWDNGDNSRAMGTGDKDFSVAFDYQYEMEQWTPELALGYVKSGDYGRLDSENFWFTQLGLSYQLSESLSLGAGYYIGFLTSEAAEQWDYSLQYSGIENFRISLLYRRGESASSLDNNWSLYLDYGF